MTAPSILRRVAPVVLLVGVAMTAVASPAMAQQATGTSHQARRVLVRQDSTGAMKVTVVLDGLDSLLKELLQSRALEERIGIALREYSGAAVSENRKRALELQLQKIAQNNVQLMSRIQMACSHSSRREQPEGYLGVTFSITGMSKREKDKPEVFRFDEPPEIITIESGSPAERAGVRRGDRLLALDGREVVGHDVVLSQYLVPGRKLPVRIDRDGAEQTFVVQVQKRPDSFGDQCNDVDLMMQPMRAPVVGEWVPAAPRGTVKARPARPTTAPDPPDPPLAFWTFEPPPPVAMAGFSSIVAGAQLTTLTDDFKELTGADAGVLVQRVAPETPAAMAGLRGGDVIVEAGDREVTSARLLQRLISESDTKSLKLKVVRKGKARTVWLKW